MAFVKCNECIWPRLIEKGDSVFYTHYECHRRAPTTNSHSMGTWPTVGTTTNSDPDYVGKLRETDGCGEGKRLRYSVTAFTGPDYAPRIAAKLCAGDVFNTGTPDEPGALCIMALFEGCRIAIDLATGLPVDEGLVVTTFSGGHLMYTAEAKDDPGGSESVGEVESMSSA